MVEQRRQEAEQDQLGRDDHAGQRGHEPGGHAEQDQQDRAGGTFRPDRATGRARAVRRGGPLRARPAS
ncbi:MULTISPECIES: hypothetical protein [Actinomadura]|uniref:Uncharacterized protein n=1 Tax=Actinomadura geliboluensis TaxID=882440 RepID=A0A5S4GZV3_9ACTN|nr:hypothetical protein [Actinomadura geliboluensis]TMR38061.1 hypothetical protein ETD96_17175 [Actinomadura geliboluensis]